MARAPPFLFHQAGGSQHLQVLRDGGTADGKAAGKFAYRGRLPPEQVEDRLARGVRQRAEHLPSVSHTLR